MAKSLTLDSEYNGIPLRIIFDTIEANKRNIKGLIKFTGYEFEKPEIDDTAYVDIDFRDSEMPGGFVVDVYVNNIHRLGGFNSFQMRAIPMEGVVFTHAQKGPLLDKFMFRYVAEEGHRKEGLIGSFASSLYMVDKKGDVLLCSLYFNGPSEASPFVEFESFRITSSLTGDLPIAYDPQIK